MQPPPKTVPPLVIQKPKLEKRHRKTTPSKSRSSKSKNNVASSSATNISTATGTSAANSETHTTSTTSSSLNLAAMHPALKDAKLPKTSPTPDLTDQETVNSLLTTLFQRSLDPKSTGSKSLTSTLSPQKSTLIQGSRKGKHSQGHSKTAAFSTASGVCVCVSSIGKGPTRKFLSNSLNANLCPPKHH